MYFYPRTVHAFTTFLLSLWAILPAMSAIANDNLAIGTPDGCDQVIVRPGYALGYCYATRQASWVQYHFTREENQTRDTPRAEVFLPDPEVPSHASATEEDYRHPMYDRGHLAPAADMQHSPEAMRDSFYLSNISPQNRAMNAGIWADIEKFVRYSVNAERELYVITGPLFAENPRRIGPNRFPIPEAYYKILYDTTPPQKMIAFLVPNKRSNQPIHTFVTTVDAIEARSGLDFFSALPQDLAEPLEAQCAPEAWKRLTSWHRENITLPWEVQWKGGTRKKR